ncbi:hypothetical protein EYR36_008215 [Pleurotus pulmonarius]|nr:hypothetical protein EYR36_008215 [Pleurotus pulmonarius]KAF4605956.1 hypothetical protein EYR38_000001 [Pleurotus pulmonarius]
MKSSFSRSAFVESQAIVSFMNYDVQACNGMAGTALGRLGPLPVEIVSYIFEDTTLEDALALGMAHGQLFVIGYPPIISKLRSTHPSSLTNWSCDRVICLSDSASSLPASYLSLPERLRLMNWAIKHRKVMWRDPPLDKINRELEAKELSEIEAQEIKRKLGAYKDQSFALFQYGCSMPSIRSLERSARWDPYPFTWRRHGKLDTQRIDVLEREVLRFDPYEYDHNTLMFVNFTKREYVRAVDGEGNDVLYAAIPLLAGWGDDESIRGEWAGDRLGVVTRDAFEDRVRRDSDGQSGVLKYQQRVRVPSSAIFANVASGDVADIGVLPAMAKILAERNDKKPRFVWAASGRHDTMPSASLAVECIITVMNQGRLYVLVL